MSDALAALRQSLRERLASMRGVPADQLPPSLLDVTVRRVELPDDDGGDAFAVLPRDWEQLRHEEGGAGRPVPYWARLWPSGLALATALAADPPPAGASVLELGCGLGLPSVVAARAGARVLATDGAPDAVVFSAHAMALNEVLADVAHVDWSADGDGAALVARGPWDLVLAADVLYTGQNVSDALELLPRLLGPGSELLLADPGRAGARDFLAAARVRFTVASEPHGEVTLHRLRLRAATPAR